MVGVGSEREQGTGNREQRTGSRFVILSLSCEESCRRMGKILTLYSYEVRCAPQRSAQDDNISFYGKSGDFFAVLSGEIEEVVLLVYR